MFRILKKIWKVMLCVVNDVWYRVSLIFYDDKNDTRMSAGRICFLILFGISCKMWWCTQKDIPPTMMNCMFALLFYNVLRFPIKTGASMMQAKIASLLNVGKGIIGAADDKDENKDNSKDSKGDTPEA